MTVDLREWRPSALLRQAADRLWDYACGREMSPEATRAVLDEVHRLAAILESGDSISDADPWKPLKDAAARADATCEPPDLNKSGGSDVCPSCNGPFRRLAAIDSCRDPWHNG